MQDTPKEPKEPKKIKIVVKPSGAIVRKPTIKEEPIDKKHQPKQEKKKSILRRIGELVSNDVHNLPNKIWGEPQKKKQNGVKNMPDSNESWEDWEGQI
jgi:hypothetical protein